MIRDALDTPWKVGSFVRRQLLTPFFWIYFQWHGLGWGKGWQIFGRPMIQRHRRSEIVLGDRVCLRSWRSSNPLAPHHPVVLATRRPGARIVIGDDSGFTGTTIVADELVQIGRRVAVGANCTIVDTDFHPLEAAARQANFNDGRHAPIIIEDDVFIGMNSLILKGVTIGRGSVIGAGSVVVSDIPPGVIAAGNPAKVIRPLE